MVTELTEKIKSSLKDAAKKLTGFNKRAFILSTLQILNRKYSNSRNGEAQSLWF
jgi:predicted nucleic acid-binding protein